MGRRAAFGAGKRRRSRPQARAWDALLPRHQRLDRQHRHLHRHGLPVRLPRPRLHAGGRERAVGYQRENGGWGRSVVGQGELGRLPQRRRGCFLEGTSRTSCTENSTSAPICRRSNGSLPLRAGTRRGRRLAFWREQNRAELLMRSEACQRRHYGWVLDAERRDIHASSQMSGRERPRDPRSLLEPLTAVSRTLRARARPA